MAQAEHTSSGENPTTPMNDFFSMLGAANPMMAMGRLLENGLRVSSDIVTSISTFNDTMAELNKIAHRLNALLDDIEKPIKDIIPIAQSTLKQARNTLKKVDGLVGEFTSLPRDVTMALGTLGELSERLAPLVQFAQTAGAMFGVKPAAD